MNRKHSSEGQERGGERRGTSERRRTGRDRDGDGRQRGHGDERRGPGRRPASAGEGGYDTPDVGDSGRRSSTRDRDADYRRRVQRTVGNQGLQELYDRGTVRAKSRISSPTDREEREARRVARSVVEMGESETLSEAIGPDGRVVGGGTTSIARDAGSPGLSGPGRPLPESTRSFFERRFDEDFAGVRIHTGRRADRAARSIDAEAFTLGHDVAFAAGNYQPHSRQGRELLAHELTHVVQQRSAVGRSSTVWRQDSGEDYHHPNKFKGHFSTKTRVMGAVRTVANRSNSIDDLFETLRAAAQRSSRRYLLLGKRTPVLDIKHFFFAAHEAYSGGPTKEWVSKTIPGGETIREYAPRIPLPPSRERAVDMGNLLELNQWWNDHPSGFSSEDVPSNTLGGEFGVEVWAKADGPGDVPGILAAFLDRLKPLDPDDVDDLDAKLNPTESDW